MQTPSMPAAFSTLRLAAQLVDGIQAAIVARGFSDVRPMHGFAFVRIAAGGATVAEVAAHLGTTKQAASQLVQQLVDRRYVERAAHPDDGRSMLLVLTRRGRACTRAAEAGAASVEARWRDELGDEAYRAFAAGLRTLVRPGPLRPIS